MAVQTVLAIRGTVGVPAPIAPAGLPPAHGPAEREVTATLESEGVRLDVRGGATLILARDLIVALAGLTGYPNNAELRELNDRP